MTLSRSFPSVSCHMLELEKETLWVGFLLVNSAAGRAAFPKPACRRAWDRQPFIWLSCQKWSKHSHVVAENIPKSFEKILLENFPLASLLEYRRQYCSR